MFTLKKIPVIVKWLIDTSPMANSESRQMITKMWTAVVVQEPVHHTTLAVGRHIYANDSLGKFHRLLL